MLKSIYKKKLCSRELTRTKYRPFSSLGPFSIIFDIANVRCKILAARLASYQNSPAEASLACDKEHWLVDESAIWWMGIQMAPEQETLMRPSTPVWAGVV